MQELSSCPFLVGSSCSIFNFCLLFCRSLFVFFTFFCRLFQLIDTACPIPPLYLKTVHMLAPKTQVRESITKCSCNASNIYVINTVIIYLFSRYRYTKLIHWSCTFKGINIIAAPCIFQLLFTKVVFIFHQLLSLSSW